MSQTPQFAITYSNLHKSRNKCFVCDRPLFGPLERCSKAGHYSAVYNMSYVDGLVEIYGLIEYFCFGEIYVMVDYVKSFVRVGGMEQPFSLIPKYLDSNGFVTRERIQQLIHKTSLLKHFK